eukprot:s210_g30.t1
MRKATAISCDKCGQPWRQAYDPTFVYNPGTRAPSARRVDWTDSAQSWEDQQWVKSPRRPNQSPRHALRQRSRRQRGQDHSGSKGSGKGSDQGSMQYGVGAPRTEPDPPWLNQPISATPPPPLPPPSTPRMDPAVQEFLKECQKNPDDLPPSLQEKYHKINAAVVKQEEQVLLSAVQSMTNAKKELADAQKQRSLLHSNWTKFLQTQVSKWQEYAEQFQKAETAAVSRIQMAQTTYSAACSVLNSKKVEAGVAPTTEVIDADDPSLQGVSTTNSKKISESMEHLQVTLDSLQKSAEELAAAEQHTAKRPRTDLNEASQNASCLAFEFGHNDPLCGVDPVPNDRPRALIRHGIRRIRPRNLNPVLHFPRLVSFDELIEIVTPCDESASLDPCFMMHDQMQQWSAKPWRLKTVSNPSHSISFSDCGAPSVLPESTLASASVSVQCQVAEHCCDPLSTSAVSIPVSQGVSQVGSSVLVASVSTCSSGHVQASHLDGVQCPAGSDSSSSHRPDVSSSAGSEFDRSSQHPPPVPEVPPFARDILRLPVRGAPVPAASIARGVWIRVWYIHLQIHARSFLVRHRLLHGPPHLWQQLIEDLWTDVLIPDEVRQIHLVTPAPPRNHFELELVHDLILSQGVGGRFLPGLVTMRPVDPGIDRAIYSGAVALPPVINCQSVVDSLALTQLCQDRLCTVRQGRTVMTDAQYIPMQSGFSHVVDVGRLRSRPAGSVPTSVPVHNRPPQQGNARSGPDHSLRLELLTQLRAAGHLSGTVANVDEVDAVASGGSELDIGVLAAEDIRYALPVSSSCPENLASQCVQSVLSSTCDDTGFSRCAIDPSRMSLDCYDPFAADDQSLQCLAPLTLPAPSESALDLLSLEVGPAQCKLPVDPGPSERSPTDGECVHDPPPCAIHLHVPSAFTRLDALSLSNDRDSSPQDKIPEDQGPGERPPTESERALRPVAAGQVPPPLPVIPPFARAMLNDLPEGFLTGILQLRGFMVRTWYLHHVHVLRSHACRYLQLTGPPHTWQSQLIALWIHRLVRHAPVQIDVVQPQPHRDRTEQIVAFDIILSQGLQAGRHSGLVSVYPPVGDQAVPRVTAAVSFLPQVSGHDIVAGVDFQLLCQQYRCLIFFRWQQIPHDQVPVHDMHPGDGFALHVHGPPMHIGDASSHEGQDAPAPVPMPDHVHSDPVPMDLDLDFEATPAAADQDHASPSELYSPSSSPGVQGLQRVYLYRLGQPVVVAFVRWHDPALLYDDVVAALAVHPMDVVIPHAIRALPLGQQINEKSLIIQMRQDIAFAADEQLLLVDVIAHQHGAAGISLAPQFTDRRVVKVQHPLTRFHLLQYAHVANFCEFVQHRCLVRVDNTLWPRQDHGPRDLLHGTYVQTILPPPSPDLLVPRTIQLVEDASDVMFHGDFASMYPRWFLAPASDAASDHVTSPEPEAPPPDVADGLPVLLKGSVFTDECLPAVVPVEHVGDDDHYAPPDFTRDVSVMPVPAGPALTGLPPIHDLADFQLQFGVTFRDYAHTDFAEQGPILHVRTWLIQHGTRPRCLQSVMVELEQDPMSWPAAICAPWQHLLHPGNPIALREVRPNPPRLFRDVFTAHIIIEQDLDFPRYAALISVLAEGEHVDGKMQLAISVPHYLSAELLLQELHLESRCRVYRCTAWSGVMQFLPDVAEHVFSGIGIYLHIHGPRFRHLLRDYGDQPFWHISDSSGSSSSQGSSFARRLPQVLPPGCAHSLRALADATAHDVHPDGFFVPQLRVAWQQYLVRTSVGPYQFQVVTWFCDHLRLPRSAEYRIAHLPLDFHAWKDALAHVWNDWVLPGLELSYYVVTPLPYGNARFVAHIILAQNEMPEFASVLISSTLPDDQPWEPVHRVARMPQLVDHHLLIHEGGLLHMCPPHAFGLHCQSWHDALELTDGRLYLASSGYGFFIAASPIPHVRPAFSVLPEHKPSTWFHRLAGLLAQLVTRVHLSVRANAVLLPAVAPASACDSSLVPMSATSVIHSLFGRMSHLLTRLSVSVSADVFESHSTVPPLLSSTPELPAVSSPSPRTLSLQDTLPDASACIRVPCRQVYDCGCHVLAANLGLVHPFASVVKWHPNTLEARVSCPDWTCELPLRLLFYTDGASRFCSTTSSRQAAAAAVLLVETADGMRFGGFRAFTVPLPATAPFAEHVAIFIAHVWCLQVCDHLWSSVGCSGLPVTFAFDCLAAGFAASGAWDCMAHSSLHGVTRALGQWLGSRFSCRPTYSHVAGHSGDAWNEAADAACWACLHDWISGTDFASVFAQHFGAFSGHFEWLWFLEHAWNGHVGYPSIRDGCFVFPLDSFSTATPSVHDPQAFVSASTSSTSAATVEPFVLRCATANVLTLSTGATHGSTYVSARQEALMQAFAEAGFHLVGVQETRSKLTGHHSHEHFHILAASSTSRGHYGVQLWIARSFDVSGRQTPITAQHMRVLHADPRLLLVRLTPPGLNLLVIVGHVPCDGGGADTQTWWRSLTKLLPASCRLWPKIMLVDANSRLGSLTSDAVGDFQASEENEAGALLHQWLIDQAMFAPQTMAAYHHGSATTFVHSTGKEGRIDFVLLDESLRHPLLRTYVPDIDLSLQKQDHFPVAADVPLVMRPPSARSAPVLHHRSSVAAVSPPVVDWSLDVHTHADQLHRWLQCHQLAPHRWPRKKHLQDATWQLVQHKAFHWKRVRQIRATVRTGLLRTLFQAWRADCLSSYASVAPVCRPWLRLADYTIAWHLHQHRLLASKVLQAVRNDDRTYFQAFAARHSDESFPNLWKSLRCLLPKNAAKCRNNLRCVGPLPSELFQHFNALEAGEPTHFPDLLTRCHARQQQALADCPLVVPLSHLPSRLDFEKICARAKRNKAPGLDGVTVNTLSSCFEHQSDIGHQLILKAFLTGCEPLQWKGGLMHVIPKKSGVLRVNMMRGIMLLTSFGKLYHATLRKLLLPWLTSSRIPAQLGGFKCQQTSFATHLLRTFCRLAVHHNLSFGVVFVDVKAAFHSMLREHTFGGAVSLPPRLQAVLVDAGLDLAQLSADIALHAQFFDSVPNLCLQRAVQDAHCDTWYALAHHPGICQTHRGSRPGSPLADIAYNIAMRSVLHEVHVQLTSFSWLRDVALLLPVFPPLVTWVDDLAVPVPTCTAHELDDRLVQVLTVIDSVFCSYGLQLNRQPGKTEIVCQYRGTGAPACRDHRFIEQHGSLALPGGDAVRVVAQYEHLGTSFSQSLSFASELRVRAGKAAGAFRQLSKSIFRNRHLSPVLRLQLLESLVLSIVMYGSGTWSLLSHRQYCRLSHTILAWQRQITGDAFWKEEKLSDADFLAKWRLPSLSVRLAKHRLLYAFQLVQSAPQDLITCVTAEAALPAGSPWCSALRHAIDWLCLQAPSAVAPAPASDPDSLIHWLHTHCRTGPALVRRCVRRSVHQDRLMYEVKLEVRSIYHVCAEAGLDFADPAPPPLSADAASFPCHLCDREFASVQGLQAHRWKAHGLFSEERKYVFDTTCRACHKCFWTVQRLQQHLRWSRRHVNGCFSILQRDFVPLAEPVSCPRPASLQHVYRLPACPVDGPLPPPGPPAWERIRDTQLAALRLAWTQLGLPDCLPLDCQRDMDAACNQLLQSWTSSDTAMPCDDSIIDQWTTLLETFSPDTDPDSIYVWAFLRWGRDVLLVHPAPVVHCPHFARCVSAFEAYAICFPIWELLRGFDACARMTAPDLPAPLALPIVSDTRVKHDLEVFSRSFFDQSDFLRCVTRPVVQWPSPHGVPVVTGYGSKPTLFILHMFSGRRRENDCHDMVFKLASQYFPDFDVLPLSVDTAVDPLLGDLSTGPNFTVLLSLADCGAFALNLTGPPCETWTAARHIRCENLFGRGPRPLRLCASPWGLPELSKRELTQLSVGTQLMLHSLGVEVRVVLHGGGSLMEHPSEPRDQSYASIWRTDIHRNLIMRGPSAIEVYLEQWRYGADCIKPTVLRGVGLPGIDKFLRSHSFPDAVRPKRVLEGYDEQSRSFRTSAAKEYPSGLCQAMIHSVFQALHERIRREGTISVPWSTFSTSAQKWVHAIRSDYMRVNEMK